MTPTPDWAQCHVEIYEAPGWLDDCFRSGWTLFQASSSQSFVNAEDVSGDYAIMTVTEGTTPTGCGYRKDVSAQSLSTATYPLIRVRLRGRGTAPRYRISLEYTDATETDSGWLEAPSGFDVKMMELESGKTIQYVKLYAKSNTGSATAYIDYDYALIVMNPPLIPAEVEEVDIDLQTTTAVCSLDLRLLDDPLLGVTVIRFRLDEGFGSKAYDDSKYRNHGIINGASWVDGKYGMALDFDEAGEKVTVEDDDSLDLTTAITLRACVKPRSDGVDTDYGIIIEKYGSYHLFIATGDDFCVRLDIDGDWKSLYHRNFGDWEKWYDLVATWKSGDYIRIYCDGELKATSSSTYSGSLTVNTNNLTIGNRYTGTYTWDGLIDEPTVLNRQLSATEVKRLFQQGTLLSGAARAGAGNIVMVYLAAADESLVYKLVTARVIDREMSGDPDNPIVKLICEDLGEILHERTFTHEYATARWISGVVEDIVSEAVPELEKGVDPTDRTIINDFRDENTWSLLQKMAETAHFASGENGANFYVDPGGALRFKKYGSFSCGIAVSDGSDGTPANILQIAVKETIKGNPRLANDVRVIIFEEESHPRDEDAWTESAESWSSPDPTDSGYPQSDTGDKQSGTASIHFNTTNPGSQYRMRYSFGEVDISGFDQIKFYFKHGTGLSPESLEVKIQRGSWMWTWDYRTKSGITPPSANTWDEITVDLPDMTKTGNPGNTLDHMQIRAYRSTGDLGAGGFLIDKLRFVRSEKAGTASDSESQAAYGKRTHVEVDKTITNLDYAGYIAGNLLAHRKEPLVLVQAKVPGKGQLGFRPPMIVTVTSLKDGLDQVSFQIQRSRHRYTSGGGYVCDLEMLAARKANGAYEPKVAPAVADIGTVLAKMRRRQMIDQLNSLRAAWE